MDKEKNKTNKSTGIFLAILWGLFHRSHFNTGGAFHPDLHGKDGLYAQL
jgi:hypothetical protein